MFIATFDIKMVRNWNKHIFLYLIPAGAKNTKILMKKKQAELHLKSNYMYSTARLLVDTSSKF